MMQTILGFFGYARIPLAAVQLIEKIICDLAKPDPPITHIIEALKTLNNMLRLGRKLSV